MLDAAQEVEGFVANSSFDEFCENRLLANGVVRSLEVIGEAAAQVSAELKDSLKEIPWRDIVSMRNRLIHAYFDINYNVVWRTVKNDVPKLAAQLKLILGQAKSSGDKEVGKKSVDVVPD
jgi:uncharacterized protein with HEPN domain